MRLEDGNDFVQLHWTTIKHVVTCPVSEWRKLHAANEFVEDLLTAVTIDEVQSWFDLYADDAELSRPKSVDVMFQFILDVAVACSHDPAKCVIILERLLHVRSSDPGLYNSIILKLPCYVPEDVARDAEDAERDADDAARDAEDAASAYLRDCSDALSNIQDMPYETTDGTLLTEAFAKDIGECITTDWILDEDVETIFHPIAANQDVVNDYFSHGMPDKPKNISEFMILIMEVLVATACQTPEKKALIERVLQEILTSGSASNAEQIRATLQRIQALRI